MSLLEHEKQIKEYEDMLRSLKEKSSKSGSKSSPWTPAELEEFEQKLQGFKDKIYKELTPWERVLICRHPNRPKALDYIRAICDEFQELSGDRLYGDDPAIIAGLAIICGKKFVLIAQEKGHDTPSRIGRNFGMPHPEGYRKALRCMELAASFNLPILTIVDTPGAFAGLSAEERGQGWAIADNLSRMMILPVPIITVFIGEGGSGGALALGVADRVGMLSHAYYSVVSPEGCASILWENNQKKEEAAAALKMHAEHLLPLSIIDEIIDEPQEGAHHNPEVVYLGVKEFVIRSLNILAKEHTAELLEQRYQRFRKIGQFRVE